MNRFVISCLLGLGSLAVTQTSIGATINWTDNEAGNSNGSIGTAQILTGFDNSNTNIITGSLFADGPDFDKADYFGFKWQGNGSNGAADIVVEVAFTTNKKGWDISNRSTPLILTSTVFNRFAQSQTSQNNSPIPGNNETNSAPNHWLYVYNGLTSEPPDDTGDPFTLLNLPPKSLNPTTTAANSLYYLALIQSTGGIVNYTATIHNVPRGNGTAPEPGTLALMLAGLSAGVFNRRRSKSV